MFCAERKAADEINTASVPADRAQANQKVGKLPNRFRHLHEALLPNYLGVKELSRMAIWQNGFRDQASHSSHQKTSQGGGSLSSKVRPQSMKTMQPIRLQPPA